MTAEIVQVMGGWGNDWGNDIRLVATVCKTVARVKKRNEPWFTLASLVLGTQELVLRYYATHGDSLSLAVLIHITRQQFSRFWDRRWPDSEFSKVLEAASKFNVQDTLPELRHEFCALWNQVRSNDKRRMAGHILKPIRNVYIALHQDTDSAPIGADLWDPSSYPACNVPGHSPDSSPHSHDDSASTIFARTDTAALVPASLSGPDELSSSIPPPLLIGEDLTDISPLDTFLAARQTITESPRIAFILSDLATTTPHSTFESSISAPPFSSTSPVFSLQHNDDLLAPSDGPSLPSSVASNLILDNILPKDLPPQPLSPLSANDSNIAIVGSSMWEPSAERTGDHSPHPLCGRYDIV
ncbi:hypothetical protein EDB92DRAFT_1862824 [Lactarius akahatsu]|uniref:Uncharacterized protein n=1 Tax=Lactarius akahatsu TaxID=416441 RepID=A0AAD4LL03_9AGAM|nr:hypothetical protein EDB92DRAFT_1862824 [Lactarius akahatsu]